MVPTPNSSSSCGNEPDSKRQKLTTLNFTEFLKTNHDNALITSRKYFVEEAESSLQKPTGSQHIIYFKPFLNYNLVIGEIPCDNKRTFKISLKPVDFAKAFIQKDLISTTKCLQEAIVTANQECLTEIKDDQVARSGILEMIRILATWMMSKSQKDAHIDPWSVPSSFNGILALPHRPSEDDSALIIKTLDANQLELQKKTTTMSWTFETSAVYDFQSGAETDAAEQGEAVNSEEVKEEENFNDIFINCVKHVRNSGNYTMTTAQIACALTRATIPGNTDQFVGAVQFAAYDGRDPQSNKRDRWVAASREYSIGRIGEKLSGTIIRLDFGGKAKSITMNDICPVKRLAIYQGAKYLDSIRRLEEDDFKKKKLVLDKFNSEILEHNVYPTAEECDEIDAQIEETAPGKLDRPVVAIKRQMKKLEVSPSLPPPQCSSFPPVDPGHSSNQAPIPVVEIFSSLPLPQFANSNQVTIVENCQQSASTFQEALQTSLIQPQSGLSHEEISQITQGNGNFGVNDYLEDILGNELSQSQPDLGSIPNLQPSAYLTSQMDSFLSSSIPLDPDDVLFDMEGMINFDGENSNPDKLMNYQNSGYVGPQPGCSKMMNSSFPAQSSVSGQLNTSMNMNDQMEGLGNPPLSQFEDSSNSAQSWNHTQGQQDPQFNVQTISSQNFLTNFCHNLNGGGKEHCLTEDYTGDVVLLTVTKGGGNPVSHAFSKSCWDEVLDLFQNGPTPTNASRESVTGKELMLSLYTEDELKYSVPAAKTIKNKEDKAKHYDHLDEKRQGQTMDTLHYLVVTYPEVASEKWSDAREKLLKTAVINKGSSLIREDLKKMTLLELRQKIKLNREKLKKKAST